MTGLRVYSETVSYADIVRPQTLALLSTRGLDLVLAVRPWDVAALPEVARALSGAGVGLSVWPMLADDRGRWGSIHNADEFARFAIDICDRLEAASVRPSEVLFDLEPPFAQAKTLVALGGAGATAKGNASGWVSFVRRSPAYRRGARALGAVASEIHSRSIATSMAVWPLVALDPPGREGWQGVLGTPVDALGAGHVSVMLYTSLFEGWSRGAVRRRDATALLARATARSVRRWGSKAGVSLGCVGTGAFEDEPVYRSPAELAEDVAVTRASGCEKLTLFDLGGVLSRGEPEGWLDAFVHPESVSDVATTRRVSAARVLARALTWAVGRSSEAAAK